MTRDPVISITLEPKLRRIAKIIGDGSAAAKALKRAEEYRADGAVEVLFCNTRLGMLLVVPLYGKEQTDGESK